MKILSSQQAFVEKDIVLLVKNKGKEFHIGVHLRNGKLEGDEYNAISTSYIPYFDTPFAQRKKDFNAIKKHVELKFKK